jgi:hypothetical protein
VVTDDYTQARQIIARELAEHGDGARALYAAEVSGWT